jgi:hypothetical protein
MNKTLKKLEAKLFHRQDAKSAKNGERQGGFKLSQSKFFRVFLGGLGALAVQIAVIFDKGF